MFFWLTFQSPIHFEFILVCDVSWWSSPILLHVSVQFIQHHLLKRLSLLLCIFHHLLSDINRPQRYGFISGLFVLFHWSVACFYASTGLFWVQWPWYSLTSDSVIPSTLFFFLKIPEAIQGLLWFHINFWNTCSRYVRYVICILRRIVLKCRVFW